MARILLVGSGMTTALASSLLKQKLPKVELVVWDKSKGTGGRMSTTKKGGDSSSVFDLGAQYITSTPDYAKAHCKYYEELKEAGVLSPLTASIDGLRSPAEGSHDFVIPDGSSALVKHFLNKSKPEIKFNHCVREVTKKATGWEVTTQGGKKQLFDAVVLTMPVPQIMALEGDIKEILQNNMKLEKDLKSVEYSSRFALGLFFRDGDRVRLKDGTCASYITTHPVFRFVAIDNVKRGRLDSCPSVVAHTSVPFGKANLNSTPSEMQQRLLQELKQMFPEWPDPEQVKCLKWRYSQVTTAFPGLPGAIRLGDGLFAAGDGFVHSNFDGCVESAEALVGHLADFLP